ncbi:MAG: transposase [Alphaproteobacteria bacterium]
MRTVENRKAYERVGLRHPSALADAEWALVARLIPPAKRGVRKRTIVVREVVNATFYVLATGCQWRALPKDLPPKSTAWDYLDLWNWDGTLEHIHHALHGAVRGADPISSPPRATTALATTASYEGALCLTRRAESVLGRGFGPTQGTRGRRSRVASARDEGRIPRRAWSTPSVCS